MAEFLGDLKRTDMCGKLSEADSGKNVVLMGWADGRRDFGGLIFVDLRDVSGIIQVVFDLSLCGQEDFKKAESIRNEYVLAVSGSVRKRSAETINEKLATGYIEVVCSGLKILSEAETPPFMIDDAADVNEITRLKYRYLDLRRPQLQSKLITRNKICKSARDFLSQNNFLEIETPFLGKSTPEGARDYLVPSRINKGSFYALPQSPQLYKQLLMIAGFDRYYQITKCFRDEDLRANRQPEFTQIDLEMSFAENERDVMEIMENLIAKIFGDVCGLKLNTPFKTLTYQQAMDRYGSDKPDTRFGLELVDISDIASECGFQVFSGAVKKGGSVRVINAKGFNKLLSRRDIDALTDFVKAYRAKGLAWIAYSREEGIKSVITKFFTEAELNKIYQRTDFQPDDILFFCADKNQIVYDSLGALRQHLADKYNLYDKTKFDFLWVTDFPLFEYDEEEKRYVAMHHPFTSPKNEDIALMDSDPARIRAKAYDMVINGQEAGGGSIRIHRRDIQQKMFKLLGMSEETINNNFGFFVNAFRYGAPPHGGFAFGLDRLTMLITNSQSIKDVIAFPKVQTASCLMTEAPGKVEDKQLKELSISLDI
jgi:aspartyl-tRNA synthetase